MSKVWNRLIIACLCSLSARLHIRTLRHSVISVNYSLRPKGILRNTWAEHVGLQYEDGTINVISPPDLEYFDSCNVTGRQHCLGLCLIIMLRLSLHVTHLTTSSKRTYNIGSAWCFRLMICALFVNKQKDLEWFLIGAWAASCRLTEKRNYGRSNL